MSLILPPQTHAARELIDMEQLASLGDVLNRPPEDRGGGSVRPALLDRLRGMSEAELYAALYRDPLTGVLNRRAFEEVQPDAIALVDLDSLKWVNDTHGHRAGDQSLQELAGRLVLAFGPDAVFRIAGDEFVVVNGHQEDLADRLEEVRAAFPGFSFGTGETLCEADADLRRDKAEREALGDRAARGERPKWDQPK